MLFDQFGRPITPAEVRRPERREIASVEVRDRWSTYPTSGMTPARLATILKAADAGDVSRQAEMFEEMEEKDAHLASQFQIRKLAVQGLEYEIIPAGQDATSQRVADFCREILEGLTDWDEHTLDMLDALAKGYSMMEILWDVSSGQAGIRALRWVHPKKVTFVDSLTPRVLTEADRARGEDPPPFKFVYHRYKARSGYDTRAGIMRVCAWMYLFKNFSVKDWVGFSEIYGQPLRLGKYSPNASEADKDALLTAVRAIGTDAAGIISRNTEIEFVEAQKYGSLNVYETLARFCDAQMSKAVLGQTLTSEAGGQNGEGSRALGEVHAEVREDLKIADCKALSKTITQQLLRPLVGFNFGWGAPVPKFRIQAEPAEDLATVATVYRALADMGVDISQEHVAERFRVPLRAKDETPLRPALSAAPMRREPPRAARPALQADDPTGAPTVAAITDRLLESGATDGMVERIQDLLAEATSLEDFRDRLLGLYAGLDLDQLTQVLQEALALAEMAGWFDGGQR